LAAAQHLATSGINASVLHAATWKPFDTAAVVGLARRVPALVSVENHVSGGGLASLVAEAVFDARLVRPLERVGLPDQFIECGSVTFLQSKYGLTPEHIVEAARRALTRGK
jgi:transketolase